MSKEMVNKTFQVECYWVDDALLEPEIPRQSLVFVAPTFKFEADGIYVLRGPDIAGLYRCAGHSAIAVSNNMPLSLTACDAEDFNKIVTGRVVGLMKIWG